MSGANIAIKCSVSSGWSVFETARRAAESSLTPKPGGVRCGSDFAKRLGVRLSSAAFSCHSRCRPALPIAPVSSQPASEPCREKILVVALSRCVHAVHEERIPGDSVPSSFPLFSSVRCIFLPLSVSIRVGHSGSESVVKNSPRLFYFRSAIFCLRRVSAVWFAFLM
jgi:hypothetical protein